MARVRSSVKEPTVSPPIWWRPARSIVVGKTEPQRVFELLGRKGEVSGERLALRDAFGTALAAYRRKNWGEARAGFEGCLEIVPGDGPSTALLRRIVQFCTTAPGLDWDGVWSLTEK